MSDDKKTLELLKLAAASAVSLVEGADGDFTRPTPSKDWDGRTVANHFVLWSAYALEKRGRREEMDEAFTSRDFVADPDWRTAYRAAFDRALETWSDPKTFEGEIDTGHSSMPAADIAVLLLLETVLHGWDFAKATGQGYAPDPALGEGVLPILERWADMYRQFDGFEEPVEVPAGASALDRALALSGRDPNWTP